MLCPLPLLISLMMGTQRRLNHFDISFSKPFFFPGVCRKAHVNSDPVLDFCKDTVASAAELPPPGEGSQKGARKASGGAKRSR
jgi:hypothetical protein